MLGDWHSYSDGKRTGPSEIENLLTGIGKASNAAVIGVPDEIKGSAIVCVCVPTPGVAADAARDNRNCRPPWCTEWAPRTGRAMCCW